MASMLGLAGLSMAGSAVAAPSKDEHKIAPGVQAALLTVDALALSPPGQVLSSSSVPDLWLCPSLVLVNHPQPTLKTILVLNTSMRTPTLALVAVAALSSGIATASPLPKPGSYNSHVYAVSGPESAASESSPRPHLHPIVGTKVAREAVPDHAPSLNTLAKYVVLELLVPFGSRRVLGSLPESC